MTERGPGRQPWLAAALAFVWPAVGYLYAGRVRSSLLLLLLFQPAELLLGLLAVVVPVRLANLALPLVSMLALRILLAHGARRAARLLPPGPPSAGNEWDVAWSSRRQLEAARDQ